MYDEHEPNLRGYKTFKLVRTNPYGLWIIVDETGEEVSWSQRYTHVEIARKAVDDFLKAPPVEKKSRKRSH